MRMDMQTVFALLTVLGLLSTGHSQVLDCNFDTATSQDTVLLCECRGSPCQLEQSPNDQFDWIAYQGSTPSSDTGPADDYTRQDGTGFYIYSEASDENPGNKAAVSTPPIALSTTSCLTFWYHMFGQHIGDLEVLVTYFNGSSATIWAQTGDHGNQWLEAKMLLPTTVTMVTLNTNRGGTATGMPYGDIAVDGILITEEICDGFTQPFTPVTSGATTVATTTQARTTRTTASPATSTPAPTSLPPSSTQSPTSMSPTSSSSSSSTSTHSSTNSQTSEVSSTGSTVSATPEPSSSATEKDTTMPVTSTVSDTTGTTNVLSTKVTDSTLITDTTTRTTGSSLSSSTLPSVETSSANNSLDNITTVLSTASAGSSSAISTSGDISLASTAASVNPTLASSGSEMTLWGLDETLWIIILVVGGAVILILLVIVCVQACAMRRMRTARIVRQSDDYSNIEAYNTPRANKQQDNFINAYDNMGMEHEDKTNTARSNGAGLH